MWTFGKCPYICKTKEKKLYIQLKQQNIMT